MIFLIVVLLTFISFVLICVSAYRDWGILIYLSAFFFSFTFLILTVLSIISVCANIGAEGKLASMQETRAALVYQLENDLYDNDNDLGKKELYNQIAGYNAEVAKGKKMSNNVFTYNLYPDIYDDLELIEFPEK